MGDAENSFFELQILDDLTDDEFQEHIKEFNVTNTDGTLNSLSSEPGLFDVDFHTIVQESVTTPKKLPASNNIHCELDEFLLFSNVKKKVSRRRYVFKTRKRQLVLSKLARSATRGFVKACKSFCNCNIDTTQFTDLKLHCITEVAVQRNECKRCNLLFADIEDHLYHVQTHEGDGSCKCKLCGSSFPTQAKVLLHQRTHEQIHRCSVCSKIFDRECHLSIHRKKQHGWESRCSICRKHFPYKSDLLLHIINTHIYDNKMALEKVASLIACTCDICGVSFESIFLKEKHIATCKPKRKKVKKQKSKRKSCKCQKCKRVFKLVANLAKHMYKMHNVPIEKKFECKDCDKFYLSKNSIRNHVVEHSQTTKTSEIISCINCSKSFSTKNTLRTHIRACHLAKAKGNKLSCSVCQRTVWGYYSMANHLRSHNILNCFDCKWCTKSYSRGCSLVRHAQAVHKERQVKNMQDCLFDPSLDGNIKREIVPVETKLRPPRLFCCKWCRSSYTRESNLLRHVRTMHKNEHVTKWQDCQRKPSEDLANVSHDGAKDENKENIPSSGIKSVFTKSKLRVNSRTIPPLAPRAAFTSIDTNSPVSRRVLTSPFPERTPTRIGALSRNKRSSNHRPFETVSVAKALRISANKVAPFYQPASVPATPSSPKKITKQATARRVPEALVVPTSPQRQSNRIANLGQQASQSVSPASQKIPEIEISPMINPVAPSPSRSTYRTQSTSHLSTNTSNNRYGKNNVTSRLSTKQSDQSSCVLLENDPNRLHSPGRGYWCKRCKKSITTMFVYRQHMERFHSSRTYCSICDITFPNSSKLTVHKAKRHNEEREKKFACTDCDKKFTAAVTLRGHMDVHSNKSHTCNECGKSFTLRSYLLRHMLRMHPEKKSKIETTPSFCITCKRHFKNSASLARHMTTKTHHAYKTPVKCDICGKIYANSTALHLHVTTQHLTRTSPRNVSSAIKERLEMPKACDSVLNFDPYAINSKLKVSLMIIDLKGRHSNIQKPAEIAISYVDPIAEE